MESKIFIISPETKVAFMNKKESIGHNCKDNYFEGKCKICKQWQNWKHFKDCTNQEKQEFNLAQYPSDCILFDKDNRDKEGNPIYSREELRQQFNSFKEQLNKHGINNYVAWDSPAGYHVLAKFTGFENLDLDYKKEIKRYFITILQCDSAKISDMGVVSIPDKPHFKDGVSYGIIEEKEGINFVPANVLDQCTKIISDKRERNKIAVKQEENFKDFFEKDVFFSYIKNNILNENSERNNIIFPNLALGAVKTGKSKEEIDAILKPIIQNNFPGKSYAEFEGWLRKAFSGEIKDYNYYLINDWAGKHTSEGKKFYDFGKLEFDLKSLEPKDGEKKDGRFNFIYNDDIHNLSCENTEWLVENWIPKGDIVFVAGKSGSYKTTALMHMALCIANGKLVFNKYKVKQSKVLYINEENHRQIFKSFYKRVSKSLDINTSINFILSQEEGMKLDLEPQVIGQKSDLQYLAEVVKQQKIDVIIIDVFRRVVGFDENDASCINNFFSRLKAFRKLCGGITIIFQHHMKKSNPRETTDIRDMLRGSSDITNSADTIIGIERKTGKECFVISHIKCRAALEMDKKIIMVNSGDNKDGAYMYETDVSAKEASIQNAVDKCCEKILTWVESKSEKTLSKKEIHEGVGLDISDAVVFRALKVLEQEGTVLSTGGGKNAKWVFANTKLENKQEEKKDEEKTN